MNTITMNAALLDRYLKNPSVLREHIHQRLNHLHGDKPALRNCFPGARDSSVLMGLTASTGEDFSGPGTISLVLNKRSRRVRQAGDLCYPGGSVGKADELLAWLLWFAGVGFGSGKLQKFRKRGGKREHQMRMLLVTSLREAWEEIRLNPFRVTYLGLLPVQSLVMFDQLIYPFVVWLPARQRYRPNWEVESIVLIPIRKLLDHACYGQYKVILPTSLSGNSFTEKVFPCFVHNGPAGRELLWGASFRITMDFLKIVFDFNPPDMHGLPVFNGRLDNSYLNGSHYGG
ncbi:MAG: CoA pyrophosphatase [Desulfobacteraceae bacterium]|nr:CoA pyrophosphatase [Desulfobacteraceae bacterium]